MPEGDTIYRLARRLDAALAGRVLAKGALNVPQHATADLSGFTVVGHATHGKHLLTRLVRDGSEPLTLHTHLRMDGSWTVLAPGRRLPRSVEPDVRVRLDVAGGGSAVGIKLPVVELLTTRDEHTAVGHLGPDPLRADWDADEAVRRLLADPARPFVAALLDQRLMAGLGNLWVNEVSFLRGVWPWTPIGDVDVRGAVKLAARMLRFSATHPRAVQVTTGDLRPGRQHWVSGRAGQPCLRCGTTILVRAEVSGDPEQRRTWWCPSCQPQAGPRAGDAGGASGG